MSRPEVVAALISGIGAMDGMDYGLLIETATPAEIHEATVRLRDAALSGARPVPEVLALNLWQVTRLIVQGRAFEYAVESLPLWRSWPDKSLADVLKTETPEKVARIRSALRAAGLDVDEGETGGLDDDDEPAC